MKTFPAPPPGPHSVEMLIKSIENQNLEIVTISDSQFRAAMIILLSEMNSMLHRITNQLEQGK
jgi:hypothetical protein